MASNSLQFWHTRRIAELDEIELAHQRVGGKGRGRRYATRQINHAYAMLLSSQFQGFCRDLHSEAVDHLANSATNAPFRAAFQAEFTLHRKLDKGNPTSGNIGADFNRLGVRFWDQVTSRGRRNETRRDALDDLARWRNAIAHQDFDPVKLGGIKTLRFNVVQQWRKKCDQLSIVFDRVMHQHLLQITGAAPW